MSGLVAGQALPCGCVVGFYWCGPHDIYARRTKSDRKWCIAGDGYGWRTLEPNTHLSATPIRPEYDDYDDVGGCSCHISPPCSYCMEQPEDDEEDDA